MALRNKESAMNKMSRCRTRNLAPVHSRRGRECDCEFRANRTLMRLWENFGDLPIRGTRGVLWTHPWCLKGVLFKEKKKTGERRGKRKGRRRKKRGKRVEERERGARLVWRKGLSPRLEWKEDERRWR
ncbi:hypothetical protein TNCV_758291 [Trichonephila clavipes]|nr:hypothetical protein TNCV_758291 [Trichonephila clavipes]